MRLWHYKLLPFLDDFHIVAQWRELLAIKGAIDKNGTPNHRLVNNVLDYSLYDFKKYMIMVVDEMKRRNLKFSTQKYVEFFNWECDRFPKPSIYDCLHNTPLFSGWHNVKYLRQCYYNLEEKHDCGIVSDGAWTKISQFYQNKIKGESK